MDEHFKSLFIAYLEKTISKTEEQILIQWLKMNPASLNEFSDLYKIWSLYEFASFDKQFLENEWGILLQKVLTSQQNSKTTSSLFFYWLPRIAAVFLLGAVIAFAISYQIYNPKNTELVYHEVSSPAGAKSKVTLPDGSTIWLNAGSSLKYSNQYDNKNREVLLTGEAFFDVAKDKKRIFIVKTADLNIKAYGTTFNVKSYPEENTVETTLIEGSIGVTRTKYSNKKNDEVMLKPNQRVVYYKPTQHAETSDLKNKSQLAKAGPKVNPKRKLTYMISKGIDPKPFTSWKDGVLVINSETLEELAVKLERKYDVHIHFKDENLRSLKITGALKDETLGQVIEAIGIASQIDFEIDERDVWLKNKK